MWDHVKLLSKLGEGGMGEVWLAYDDERAAQYVVKKLHPHLLRDKDIARFKREIEHLRLLIHPSYYSGGEKEVMPFSFENFIPCCYYPPTEADRKHP